MCVFRGYILREMGNCGLSRGARRSCDDGLARQVYIERGGGDEPERMLNFDIGTLAGADFIVYINHLAGDQVYRARRLFINMESI